MSTASRLQEGSASCHFKAGHGRLERRLVIETVYKLQQRQRRLRAVEFTSHVKVDKFENERRKKTGSQAERAAPSGIPTHNTRQPCSHLQSAQKTDVPSEDVLQARPKRRQASTSCKQVYWQFFRRPAPSSNRSGDSPVTPVSPAVIGGPPLHPPSVKPPAVGPLESLPNSLHDSSAAPRLGQRMMRRHP